jgi:hypothetical protein
MAGKQGQTGLYRNVMSYLGGLVAVASLTIVAMIALATASMEHPSPYIGIFGWVVFPSIAGGGVLMFLLGMRLEAKRRVRTGATEALPYPAVDLNDPSHRKRFAFAIIGGSVGLSVFAVAGYNGFLLTESVGFCGRTCHTPMEPEYTAYLQSPHARVRCVECHVGEGAGWYVHSKLSGARQLFAVLFNTYQRPIPTPIHDLRPARETCQHCHWPEKFFGAQLTQKPHFRYDEKNTPEQISLLVKTGGGGGVLGQGIHWHMFIDNKVEYAAEDEQLQHIPWVKVTKSNGTVVEYQTTDHKVSAEDVAGMKHRVMDCMDCHNRPSHNYEPPDTAVDKALLAGQIKLDLPFVKRAAVEALDRDYGNRTSAHNGLRKDFMGFYQEKYPALVQSRAADLEKAVETIIGIYDRTVFPDMKVSWKTYPINIGHRNWPGCFRCHDGKHKTASGEVLSNACTICHTMPVRGPQSGIGDSLAAPPDAAEKWHPWEMPEKHLAVAKHKELQCHQCHAAGHKPFTDCGDCHK